MVLILEKVEWCEVQKKPLKVHSAAIRLLQVLDVSTNDKCLSDRAHKVSNPPTHRRQSNFVRQKSCLHRNQAVTFSNAVRPSNTWE